MLDAFEALVTAWPEVRECHMIRGGGDFLLRLVARDTAHENELTAPPDRRAGRAAGADAADHPHRQGRGGRADRTRLTFAADVTRQRRRAKAD